VGASCPGPGLSWKSDVDAEASRTAGCCYVRQMRGDSPPQPQAAFRHAARTAASTCSAGSAPAASSRSTISPGCGATAREPQRRQHPLAGPARGSVEQGGVGGGNPRVFEPAAGPFDVLRVLAALERLPRRGQAQGQHVPADALGAVFERHRHETPRDAAAVGDGLQRQPLEPCAAGHAQAHVLLGRCTFAAIETGGAGRGDQRMRTGLHIDIDLEPVAAHHTARWVHEHVLADRLAFRIQRLQHAQWAFVAVVRDGACAVAAVAQAEPAEPAGRRGAVVRRHLWLDRARVPRAGLEVCHAAFHVICHAVCHTHCHVVWHTRGPKEHPP
jgi:hypothetical protein